MAIAKQQREHFRIDYPLANRAKLVFKNKKFDIIDMSQRGVKFFVSNKDFNADFTLGTPISASVQTLVGKSIPVIGRIIRIFNTTVILHLEEDISLLTMNEEHRFIIKNFSKQVEE